MTQIERRVVAVTGAGSGIGAMVANGFATSGDHLALHDIRFDDDAVAATRARAENSGAQLTLSTGDLTDPTEGASFIQAALDTFGRIDVLVTCAGILRCDTPAEDIPWEQWREVLAVNLDATWACIQSVIPHMRGRGSGRIITISSELALTGGNGYAAYCASKGAVIGLTKALARELAPDGVLVNSVAPGPVDTPMIVGISENNPEERMRLPLRRFGRAEEIAAVVQFLAGPAASLMVGQVVSPNGGAVI